MKAKIIFILIAINRLSCNLVFKVSTTQDGYFSEFKKYKHTGTDRGEDSFSTSATGLTVTDGIGGCEFSSKFISQTLANKVNLLNTNLDQLFKKENFNSQNYRNLILIAVKLVVNNYWENNQKVWSKFIDDNRSYQELIPINSLITSSALITIAIDNISQKKTTIKIFQKGDCLLGIFRKSFSEDNTSFYYTLDFLTPEQQTEFNMPYQFTGMSHFSNLEGDAGFEQIINVDEIVMLGSDGLFDNVPTSVLTFCVNYLFKVFAGQDFSQVYFKDLLLDFADDLYSKLNFDQFLIRDSVSTGYVPKNRETKEQAANNWDDLLSSQSKNYENKELNEEDNEIDIFHTLNPSTNEPKHVHLPIQKDELNMDQYLKSNSKSPIKSDNKLSVDEQEEHLYKSSNPFAMNSDITISKSPTNENLSNAFNDFPTSSSFKKDDNRIKIGKKRNVDKISIIKEENDNYPIKKNLKSIDPMFEFEILGQDSPKNKLSNIQSPVVSNPNKLDSSFDTLYDDEEISFDNLSEDSFEIMEEEEPIKEITSSKIELGTKGGDFNQEDIIKNYFDTKNQIKPVLNSYDEDSDRSKSNKYVFNKEDSMINSDSISFSEDEDKFMSFLQEQKLTDAQAFLQLDSIDIVWQPHIPKEGTPNTAGAVEVFMSKQFKFTESDSIHFRKNFDPKLFSTAITFLAEKLSKKGLFYPSVFWRKSIIEKSNINYRAMGKKDDITVVVSLVVDDSEFTPLDNPTAQDQIKKSEFENNQNLEASINTFLKYKLDQKKQDMLRKLFTKNFLGESNEPQRVTRSMASNSGLANSMLKI